MINNNINKVECKFTSLSTVVLYLEDNNINKVECKWKSVGDRKKHSDR